MRLQYPETHKENYLHVAYKSETAETRTVSELQAKIIELEGLLKTQKQTADKGASFMQIIYGSKFEADFLF